MAALSIGNLEDGAMRRLRERAGRNGRSVESEARAILADAVREPAVAQPRSGDGAASGLGAQPLSTEEALALRGSGWEPGGGRAAGS
jgi:plasmid stability protein